MGSWRRLTDPAFASPRRSDTTIEADGRYRDAPETAMDERNRSQGIEAMDARLHWADLEAFDPADEDAVRSVLSPAEERRLGEFRHEPSRRCYLVTRRLVRGVLSELGDRAAEDWRFETGEHGRPRLANPTPSIEDLDFNLAHSRRKVVVAVVFGGRVGVDLEPVGREVDHRLVARKFFAPAERRAIQTLDETRRRNRFLELWVLKEAWLKADGRGISAGLDEVVFSFDDPAGPRLVRLPDDDPDRWSIGLARVDDHFVALARRPG